MSACPIEIVCSGCGKFWHPPHNCLATEEQKDPKVRHLCEACTTSLFQDGLRSIPILNHLWHSKFDRMFELSCKGGRTYSRDELNCLDTFKCNMQFSGTTEDLPVPEGDPLSMTQSEWKTLAEEKRLLFKKACRFMCVEGLIMEFINLVPDE